MAGSVIQGYFPHGVKLAQLHVATSPAWVQERIAAGRGATAVTQPKTAAPVSRATPNGTAFCLPSHLTQLPVSGGQPLNAGVRQRMEAAFGQRFADVRIHVGPHAQSVGAIAFTHGVHIHFAPGHYDAGTQRGRQILAHELAHVVQQRAGRVQNPFGSGVAIVQNAILEAEAERMAHRTAVQAKSVAPARFIQLKAAIHRHAARRGAVIQKLSVGATVLNAIAGYNHSIAALAQEFGIETTNLISALIDPAFNLEGAIQHQTINEDLKNPLNFASCFRTAETLHPLVGQEAVDRGGIDGKYQTGAALRDDVNALIAAMDTAANNRTPVIVRITFGGHGFSIAGTADPDQAYRFELIESFAGVHAIHQSLQAGRVFTLEQIRTNLRNMASDTIGDRRLGANAMGWDANNMFLGEDPKQNNRIDFPDIEFKWWSRALYNDYSTRWMAQFKQRFNLLADIMAVDLIQ